MSFGRITSFLGGAAAASLLIGLFTLVDSHSSQKEQLLADRAKEVFREELPAEQDEWTASESAGGSEEKQDIPQLAPYRNEPRPATASPSGPTSRQRPGRTPRPYSPSAFSRCRS